MISHHFIHPLVSHHHSIQGPSVLVTLFMQHPLLTSTASRLSSLYLPIATFFSQVGNLLFASPKHRASCPIDRFPKLIVHIFFFCPTIIHYAYDVCTSIFPSCSRAPHDNRFMMPSHSHRVIRSQGNYRQIMGNEHRLRVRHVAHLSMRYHAGVVEIPP